MPLCERWICPRSTTDWTVLEAFGGAQLATDTTFAFGWNCQAACSYGELLACTTAKVFALSLLEHRSPVSVGGEQLRAMPCATASMSDGSRCLCLCARFLIVFILCTDCSFKRMKNEKIGPEMGQHSK